MGSVNAPLDVTEFSYIRCDVDSKRCPGYAEPSSRAHGRNCSSRCSSLEEVSDLNDTEMVRGLLVKERVLLALIIDVNDAEIKLYFYDEHGIVVIYRSWMMRGIPLKIWLMSSKEQKAYARIMTGNGKFVQLK